MKTAFVLGNGISRQGLDLDSLSRLGPVFGCNALYRDFAPTILVATDDPIAREIERSGYPRKHRFITRNPVSGTGSEKIRLNFNWSSGPIALSYACASGATEIFLLGFDLGGISGKFNNVYSDTEFYKSSSDLETYSGNWVAQIVAIMSEHKLVKFVRAVDHNSARISVFEKFRNYSEITTSDFSTSINNRLQ
jgi:hypothetical protein